MKRNVGQKTVGTLRTCLERVFKREMKRINGHFRHDFSEEKPEFVMTLKVSAYEFATSVMEEEIEILQKQLARARKKLEVYEPKTCSNTFTAAEVAITETLHDFDLAVVAHQKRSRYHRLVICGPVPQPVSEWVLDTETATLQSFSATWDNVSKIPF